jgi:hypothetical protein
VTEKNGKEKKFYGSLLGSDSILTKDMSHNPKISSNAATSIGREKLVLDFTHYNTWIGDRKKWQRKHFYTLL